MPTHHHFELTSHQPRNPAGAASGSMIGLGVLAPGLGTFADKLPSAIFGFRLHQCQDSFSPEPSELPPRQRKQPGQPGAVHSTPGRQRSLHSPRQGHSAGESQHSLQSHLCHAHIPTSPLFCGLGEELRESQPAFGNSLSHHWGM